MRKRKSKSKRRPSPGSSKVKYRLTYNSWCAMRQRCYDHNHEYYRLYGGRGIRVCERWALFKNFLEDMGERPKGKTLGRLDSDKGYYKENCQWSTVLEQANNISRNRVFTYNGMEKTLAEWARYAHICYETLATRIKENWYYSAALFAPLYTKRKDIFDSEGDPYPDWVWDSFSKKGDENVSCKVQT